MVNPEIQGKRDEKLFQIKARSLEDEHTVCY
jgi:hypothetical protein